MHWWFWPSVIIMFVFFVIFANTDNTTTLEVRRNENVEIQTESQAEINLPDDKKKLYEIVKNRIEDKFTFTDIDGIDIHSDAGTEKEDDYIIIVHLTWNQKNDGEMSKKVLSLYSEDLAATLGENDFQCKATEIAIFWNVPYLNANAKCSYVRSGNGFIESDMMWEF